MENKAAQMDRQRHAQQLHLRHVLLPVAESAAKERQQSADCQRANARNHVRLKIHVLFSPKNSLSHANGVTEGVKKQAASPQRTQQPAWYHLISHSPKRECLFALYRARPLPSKATFGTRSLQVALQPVGDSL